MSYIFKLKNSSTCHCPKWSCLRKKQLEPPAFGVSRPLKGAPWNGASMDVCESSSESSGENPQNHRIRDAAAETLVTWAQLPDTADARHRFDDHTSDVLVCHVAGREIRIAQNRAKWLGDVWNYLLRVVVDVYYFTWTRLKHRNSTLLGMYCLQKRIAKPQIQVTLSFMDSFWPKLFFSNIKGKENWVWLDAASGMRLWCWHVIWNGSMSYVGVQQIKQRQMWTMIPGRGGIGGCWRLGN